ncbi:ABC transporter permease [Clostridium oryzae]|uniref:ABC transporter permease YtrF n=1 Tax=Clostridium oryzae TaxID=1450648 RepID=A0A1V4IL52_9CLOT|nr:ABC transporter permease [Clostridium oryzae]OPJ60599.1 ABC transporter permease YtrF precursor [Clostridium oryzae]
MNIFNKVTLQSMKKSRTRTLVTVMGVILSAALITGVITFGVSLMHYMANGAAQKYGDWHVQFPNVTSSFVQERNHDQAVDNTAFYENIGYVKLNGVKTPNKPYAFIAGFNKKAFHTLPITMMEGRQPKNDGEIIVPLALEVKGSVKFAVGDKLSLDVGSRMNGNKNLGQHSPYISGKETLVPKAKKTYTVVGIYLKPYFEESSAPGYTLITKVGPQGKADNFSLFVKLKNPRRVHSYGKTTAVNHSYVFNDDVLRFMGLSENGVFNTFLYSLGGIVIAIVMIGSIFLIYNSFNISLNERTHQFGILSSVGATAKQLRNSVLFEGLCVGAMGIPIGVIVGLGSIDIVISVVAKKFNSILYANVPFNLTISLPAIIVAAVVSIVTILISAYIPAKKAANTPIMESIRQTNEIKVQSKAIKTSKLSQRIYGLEGTLALKNFKRNKKRYRSIVLSLVLSVVLFISTSSFIIDIKQWSGESKEYNNYDISFATQDMDDRELLSLYGKLKTAPGVYQSTCQAIMDCSGTAKASDLSDSYWKNKGSHSQNQIVNLLIEMQFLDDSTYIKIIKSLGLPVDEYTGQNAKFISVAKVSEHFKDNKTHHVNELANLFKRSTMNFTITQKTNSKIKMAQQRNIRTKFVNIVPPGPTKTLENTPIKKSAKDSLSFSVIAPYSLKDKYIPADIKVDKGFTFKSKSPSQSTAEMSNIIKSAGITASYNLTNFSEMLEQNRNMVFIANVFSYTFVILISLIAIANVFNTISTNIKLRRRELAMLRSVGMSDRDFQKMMNFECGFYGMKALLFGLPIASISSWLIYKVMGGNSNFVFPWASTGISVFSVFFIVFITMLYSTSKIKRENIIDSLRDDMA